MVFSFLSDAPSPIPSSEFYPFMLISRGPASTLGSLRSFPATDEELLAGFLDGDERYFENTVPVIRAALFQIERAWSFAIIFTFVTGIQQFPSSVMLEPSKRLRQTKMGSALSEVLGAP